MNIHGSKSINVAHQWVVNLVKYFWKGWPESDDFMLSTLNERLICKQHRFFPFLSRVIMLMHDAERNVVMANLVIRGQTVRAS